MSENNFIDEVIITVFGGKGGDGAVSFRREKFIPKGGPDGGDGGDGGNVIIMSTVEKNTLMDFKHKKKFRAENGKNGQGKKMYGRNGEDLIIKVPVGTLVYDYETNELIADLKYPNQYVVVARGGKGGKGNIHFTNSRVQAPTIAEKGIEGESRVLRLELKVLADVGIIGYPNVGKSTLISVISRARPKIANYHFTTLIPNLGVVDMGDGNSFVVADIPGLVPGAHEGVGLGDKFLKHVERCYCLVHILDISESEGRKAEDDYYTIRMELEKFSEELAKKPEIIAVNKIDLLPEDELEKRLNKLEEKLGKKIIPISAATRKNIDLLLNTIWDTIKEMRIDRQKQILESLKNAPDKIKLKIKPVDVDIPKKVRFEIIKWDEGVYEITGHDVEVLLKKYPIDQKDARLKILQILEKSGLERFLKKVGVKEGDTVYLGDFAFEYME
ncbi:GTPase ObgE [Marinitoga sp. 1135]|uniref:GTPase Obg n=1 Tax=Marinitoga piezophila (strain DSM 14283 / JCM 11233 / KA3) TaxID=443254 RepID=H2J3W9_MARPK|nr:MULTISPECIES: GTPase ObgE [Marinitoga]AEX84697.1 Obg family GTPase CgtA [Marinitoga piezophila KA3]APT75223.1 GTPase ObgE [Marinitoga sp. 1137]NUU95003.1 GTPase ObgE [Marinitoga sp. 1135]NUU96959.1 GTPase ObgE [Marinitoga sp. 1138]